MSKKEDAAEFEYFAEKYEFLFGKKPSKRMKLETLKKKVEEETAKGETGKDDGAEERTAIIDTMNKLVELAKAEAEKDDAPPAAIAIVATKVGTHMALVGHGKDVAITLATAMDNNEFINSIVANANLLSQMRRQEIMHQMKSAEGGEDTPQMPKPQTEA